MTVGNNEIKYNRNKDRISIGILVHILKKCLPADFTGFSIIGVTFGYGVPFSFVYRIRTNTEFPRYFADRDALCEFG
ncbi:Uncharacterised protein [Neisseria zoodegmatis]|uniref:Uncharacterized protein n=1 Tax=Neisseria zoodegmatis TaxID=326523 RepID=A0AB38DRT7_9NEIS|nr:Uncharacterised protein [Neisseria zoodegmatis]